MAHSGRRRSSKEVIERTDHKRGHSFIKYGGKEPVEVTGESGLSSVSDDMYKVRALINESRGRHYTRIKTNFGGADKNAIPLSEDMQEFISNPYEDGLAVAVRDKDTGKILGYNVFSKTNDTPKISGSGYTMKSLREDSKELENIDSSDLSLSNVDYRDFSFRGLNDFLGKYNLKHRILSEKGYREWMGSIEKIPDRMKPSSGLERKAESAAAVLGLLGAIFFLSPNFTGNAIRIVSDSNQNWIGIILFMIGLIATYFYFRKK